MNKLEMFFHLVLSFAKAKDSEKGGTAAYRVAAYIFDFDPKKIEIAIDELGMSDAVEEYVLSQYGDILLPQWLVRREDF